MEEGPACRKSRSATEIRYFVTEDGFWAGAEAAVVAVAYLHHLLTHPRVCPRNPSSFCRLDPAAVRLRAFAAQRTETAAVR